VSGKVIGVMLQRDHDLIIGILATFKTGATYVPIDSQYPHSRIEFILKDSGCHVCLTESKFISKLPGKMEKFASNKIDPIVEKYDKDEPKYFAILAKLLIFSTLQVQLVILKESWAVTSQF
jgi:microcystin synthetase protein McyE